jgi:hypothetical protein
MVSGSSAANLAKRITAFINNRPTAQMDSKLKKRNNLSLRIKETLDAAKALHHF